MVSGWSNLEHLKDKTCVERAALWDKLPYTIDIKEDGHPNLGEVTVGGKIPRDTFAKLFKLCSSTPPVLETTDGGYVSSCLALNRFGQLAQNLTRFICVKGLVMPQNPSSNFFFNRPIV